MLLDDREPNLGAWPGAGVEGAWPGAGVEGAWPGAGVEGAFPLGGRQQHRRTFAGPGTQPAHICFAGSRRRVNDHDVERLKQAGDN